MQVKQVMKKPLVVEKDMTLAQASMLMAKHNISSILVVSKGKVAGIITHQDVVHHYGESTTAFAIMSKNVVTCSVHDSTEDVVGLLVHNHISILPVLDDSGILVGVIHAKDILSTGLEDEDFLMD
jgi:CBS domain-containing protein